MYKKEEIINQIIAGDCLENLSKIPDESIDVIFADPPYWMQTEGQLLRVDGAKFSGVEDKWDKFENYKSYDDFSEKWLVECRRILKPNGSIWVIGSFQNIYRLGYIMQNLGFWILNDVIWDKPNAVPNFAGTRFQNSHETLLWCSKNQKAKPTFNYKTMKFLNDGKQEKSVWNIGICIGGERLKDASGNKIHSTQKPEELLKRVILSSSKPDDVILDPFFGTGTTGAVAKRLGRNFIGLERESKYIEAATVRISNVEVERSDLYNLSLEVKPPRVSIQKLIESGFLSVGEKFFDKNGRDLVVLNKDGYLNDSEEDLSIHKMSAKILGRENFNGWTYWCVERNGKMKSINDFRYEFSEKENE